MTSSLHQPLPDDDFQPIRALNDLLFCERRCALHRVEQVWVDNVHTIEGTHGHRRADLEMERSVQGVRVVRAVWLRSRRLGLVGKADVVEFRPPPQPSPRAGRELPPPQPSPRTGRELPPPQPSPRAGRERELPPVHGGIEGGPCAEMSADGGEGEAACVPYPVEYKRGKRRWDNDDVQLCAQALCLEEMLGTPVPAGAVFHLKSKRRREILFTPELREKTERAARRLHELVASEITPPPVLKARCRGCSLHDLCLPELFCDAVRFERYDKLLWSPVLEK